MAKIQFNCRLALETINWINKEAKKRSARGKKWSQADVVTLLVHQANGDVTVTREGVGKYRVRFRGKASERPLKKD